MKLSLYIETSVIGAYLDNGDTFRRDLTIRWFEHELSEYRTYSSMLAVREIEFMDEPYRTGYLKIAERFEHLELSDEAVMLADGYITRGIIQRKYMADALHLALASFNKIDYFVTWNFGHIANVRKQARLKMFNAAAGFFSPTIVTPEFLVHS
jgi:predicted nucleic acid-binding protein